MKSPTFSNSRDVSCTAANNYDKGRLVLQDEGGQEEVENIIKGVKSERLFFEPEATSSIMEEATSRAVAMTMDSRDPYMDFKKSMEEMVEAHMLSNKWDELYKLLCCYLKLNTKRNHGYIIGAFVDVLFAEKYKRPCFCHPSPASALSTETSPSSSSSCSFELSSSNNCTSLHH